MVRKHIKEIPLRRKESHKGDYGKVLIVAGSPGMTGAAFLSSMGALKAGSGLVINGIPASLNHVMETKLTEVMTLPLAEDKKGYLSLRSVNAILDLAGKCAAVAVGPGLGRAGAVSSVVKELLNKIRCPLVIDADGINAIAGYQTLLKKRKYVTVITPHPGEMARLIGKSVSFVQEKRADVALKVARETGVVVCLKGHRTVVAGPGGEIYVNTTGNSGMATGGTGDVLTGMIASFIGQGVSAHSASVSAVYLHGLAGDIAAGQKGPFSMIATDILESMPLAFKKAGLF